MRDWPVLSCWSMKVWYCSVDGHARRLRSLALKQALAKATFSRVHVTRSVFTLVLDSTEFRLKASVWSTSDSSRAARPVGTSEALPTTVGMIWFVCGDDSRSQRTL